MGLGKERVGRGRAAREGAASLGRAAYLARLCRNRLVVYSVRSPVARPFIIRGVFMTPPRKRSLQSQERRNFL